MSKLNFRKPTLDDIDNIMRALKYVKHNACDYTPTNIIMWVDEYNTEIAFDDSDLYIKYNIDGMIFFGVPFVMSGIGKGIENLIKYTEDNDIELAIGDVEPEIFAIIDRIYPGQFKVNYQRDGADYPSLPLANKKWSLFGSIFFNKYAVFPVDMWLLDF